jgi:hypothetical protein
VPVSQSLRSRAKSVRVVRRLVVEARHAGVRRSDGFLVSYPKSGNTWLRFMLAELIAGREVDFETVEDVVPTIGAHRGGVRTPGGGRLIKSHEPYRPTYGRRYGSTVYMARDPRKVVVSYYWFKVRRGEFGGSLAEFVEEFLAGRVDGYGMWVDHVDGWLNAAQSDGPRIHLVRYEDMLMDTVASLHGVARFLQLHASAESIQAVVAANSRTRMAAKEVRSTTLSRRPRADIRFVGPEDEHGRGVLDAADGDRILRACGGAMERLGYG